MNWKIVFPGFFLGTKVFDLHPHSKLGQPHILSSQPGVEGGEHITES